MFNLKYARILFITSILISLLLPIFLYEQLPERMASHFNLNNEADRWMNKNSYLLFHYGLILFFSILFGGFAFLLPKMPASFINIPNKDFWLNEKRKNFTFDVLRTLLFYLGTLCLLLFIALFFSVYKANVDGSNKLSSFSWILILVFLGSTGVLTIKYILFFNNKEDQTGDE